jgi:hypothetical protein
MKYLLFAVLFLTACQKETYTSKMVELTPAQLSFDMQWLAATVYPVPRPEVVRISHIKYEFGEHYMATIAGQDNYRIEYLCHYSPLGDTCYITGSTESYCMAGDTLCKRSYSYENVSAWGVIEFKSKRYR